PAQAQATPEQLAQRTDGDDHAAGRMGGERRWGQPVEPQGRERLVFDHRGPELAGEAREAAALPGRDEGGGGSIEGGRQVDESGLRPGQQLANLGWPDPLDAYRHRHEPGSCSPKGVERAGKGGTLNERRLARVQEGAGNQAKRLLTAGGHEDFL